MPASAATLHHLARETGFRAETLEKVVRLGDLARDFTAQPLLERSLALKGGTAINLALGPPARLSVDLDFNFVGSLAREEMLAQRPEIEALVERIARGQGYQVQWSGPAHAARNAHLAYPSVLGGNDAIKVDINYQHRQPLGDTTIRELWMPGEIGRPKVRLVPEREILAGKLVATLDRAHPRDLFDTGRLPEIAGEALTSTGFKRMFVAISGMLPHSLTTYGRERLGVSEEVVERQLVPMLAPGHAATAESLTRGAWGVLEPLLALDDAEREYSDRLQTGDFRPDLLFPDDADMRSRIAQHPALLWKVQNAQAHSRSQGKNRRRDA